MCSDEFKMRLLWLSMICFRGVVHAAVTDLDGVAIEDFSKLVVFREAIVFLSKESVSDVGANIFAEWGVVPEYVVPLPVFSLGRRIWFVV